MTTTLKDLRKHAEDGLVATYDEPPPNHFGATIRLLGLARCYVLRGDLNDEDAPVVGRIDLPETGSRRAPTFHIGGNFLGGSYGGLIGTPRFPDTTTAVRHIAQTGEPADDTPLCQTHSMAGLRHHAAVDAVAAKWASPPAPPQWSRTDRKGQ